MLSNPDMSANAKFGPHLLVAIAILVCSAFVQATPSPQTSEACVLPQDLQREVAGKYPTAKIIELSDLEDDDRKFFQSDHDNSCQGRLLR